VVRTLPPISPRGALEHGASYYVERGDLLGRTTTYPSSGADDLVGIAVSGQFNSPQFGPQVWQLFSLPVQLQGTPVADLLTDALGADAWASESWNGTQNVRGAPNPQPGRPVWLIAKDAVQIQVEGTTAAPSDGQEIKLKKGWNLVANPYTFPVAFGNVLLRRDTGDLPLSHPSAAAFVRARFWRWEDTSANDVTDGDYEMLEDFDDEWLPWEGYWMLADADATLLVIPFGELASAAPTLSDVARNAPVWQGMLVAHTEVSRNGVRLLLAETAQQGYDQLDIEQPPLPVHGHISLMQQGEAFQQIALDPSRDEWLWEAHLIASEPTQIAFSGGTLPGYHLYLEDRVSGSRTELSDGREISFPTGEHLLRIRLTRQRLGWDVVGIAPAETQLLPNYPNPFNPETWIPFTLAESGIPQVRIYDLAGHLVRKFGLGRLPAGRYTEPGRAIYWDGRDDRGQRVASGTYFYTLQAGDFAATRRLVVQK